MAHGCLVDHLESREVNNAVAEKLLITNDVMHLPTYWMNPQLFGSTTLRKSSNLMSMEGLMGKDIIGLIFIVANGKILKSYLTIWSHWF